MCAVLNRAAKGTALAIRVPSRVQRPYLRDRVRCIAIGVASSLTESRSASSSPPSRIEKCAATAVQLSRIT